MICLARDGYNSSFNCWGATQYALGQRKRWGWVGENVMWRWLNSKTEVVTGKVRLGDVLVISSALRGNLIHTAVYMGEGLWFHKQGKFEASSQSKSKVISIYTTDLYIYNGDHAKVNIHRLKTKKK
jgi:cell wall-associated NlpC family hydrolase